MTKKDYRAIAEAIRVAQDMPPGRAFDYLVARLMELFEEDNPRFDRARFAQYVATGSDRQRQEEL